MIPPKRILISKKNNWNWNWIIDGLADMGYFSKMTEGHLINSPQISVSTESHGIWGLDIPRTSRNGRRMSWRESMTSDGKCQVGTRNNWRRRYSQGWNIPTPHDMWHIVCLTRLDRYLFQLFFINVWGKIPIHSIYYYTHIPTVTLYRYY